jgi:dTDP-4-dehydrorhamnose reductase
VVGTAEGAGRVDADPRHRRRGQLGHDVVRACAAAGDDVVGVDRSRVDVTDRDAVLGAVTSFAPDAVVNCAAWTAVDACEDDPDRALRATAWPSAHLAEACHRTGAHLVHVSTDYVFDGSLDRPYHEWDETSPARVGVRRVEARRRAVRRSRSGRPAVVRTSWVCGASTATTW